MQNLGQVLVWLGFVLGASVKLNSRKHQKTQRKLAEVYSNFVTTHLNKLDITDYTNYTTVHVILLVY